tara:strand:- start:82 stop:477 length:396 start_codon:yes stop_codon:yes gene_type:complete
MSKNIIRKVGQTSTKNAIMILFAVGDKREYLKITQSDIVDFTEYLVGQEENAKCKKIKELRPEQIKDFLVSMLSGYFFLSNELEELVKQQSESEKVIEEKSKAIEQLRTFMQITTDYLNNFDTNLEKYKNA